MSKLCTTQEEADATVAAYFSKGVEVKVEPKDHYFIIKRIFGENK
jgi:hypothetical protein